MSASSWFVVASVITGQQFIRLVLGLTFHVHDAVPLVVQLGQDFFHFSWVYVQPFHEQFSGPIFHDGAESEVRGVAHEHFSLTVPVCENLYSHDAPFSVLGTTKGGGSKPSPVVVLLAAAVGLVVLGDTSLGLVQLLGSLLRRSLECFVAGVGLGSLSSQLRLVGGPGEPGLLQASGTVRLDRSGQLLLRTQPNAQESGLGTILLRAVVPELDGGRQRGVHQASSLLEPPIVAVLVLAPARGATVGL